MSRRHLGAVLLLAALAVGGCGEGPRSEPAPLDRFTWPTGLALAPLADGRNALVVVSSNFDLRYGQQDGGSVLVVDPAASSGDQLVVLGGARIASFGGEVAVASAAALAVPAGAAPAAPTCAELQGPAQVVVASRTDNAVYKIAMDGAGALSCGDGCRAELPSSVGDPFGVQVVCRPGETAAYVSHLRAPDSKGFLSRVDLASAAAPTLRELGNAPTSSLAYDTARQLLYVTTRFAQLDETWLRWLQLPSATPREANLANQLRGADLRSIALSRDGTRAYVAVQLFDRDLATDLSRPLELGGALAVLDLRPAADGAQSATLLRLVPIALGPNQVAVLARPEGDLRRDLVAVTSSEEGVLTIYDDEAGAVAAVIGTDGVGERYFGEQPYGLAVEAVDAVTRRLYVGSFDRGFIRTVLVNVNAPALATVESKRLGMEMP